MLREPPRSRGKPEKASAGLLTNADRAVARLLRVQAAQPSAVDATEGSWPFETPLLVSAVRCTLRYVVLPFALPLLGLASGAALSILLVLDVIAALSIVTTLRRLWRIQHPSRWQYLALALGLTVFVLVFLVSDAGGMDILATGRVTT